MSFSDETNVTVSNPMPSVVLRSYLNQVRLRACVRAMYIACVCGCCLFVSLELNQFPRIIFLKIELAGIELSGIQFIFNFLVWLCT
jgi:hypothetical protein